MTSLRQRMLEDMRIRNLAVNTQEAYVHQVSLFARHFNQSPERLGPEQIRAYQVYLATEKKLAPVREWWRVQRPQHWLFPGDLPGQHISRAAVERECQKVHRICKISKPITPHSMRHAFAVHLLEQGTDIRTIQLLLGHRSLATTAKYLRIATSKVCSTSSPLDLLPHPRSHGDQTAPQ